MAQPFSGSLDPSTYNDPRLDDHIATASVRVGIPKEILLAIKNQGEKSNPTAVSPKGAQGVMQFMPATWEPYGKGRNINDPYDNIDAGAEYMRDLLKQYKGNAKAAIAHYNGGTAAGNAVLQGQQPPAQETQNYLKRIYGDEPKGSVPQFTGVLDSSPTQFQGELDNSPQAFAGQLDTTPTSFSGDLDSPATAPTAPPTTDSGSWDGTGGLLTAIGSGIKDIYNNPVEAAKQALSSAGKLVDLVSSPASALLSYGGGIAAGLMSGDSDVAKKVKDDIAGKLSVDKALQSAGVATDNPEPFTGALDTVLGKPAKVIADSVSKPDTFWNDAIRDASMAALPIGAHIGATRLAKYTTTPMDILHDLPEGRAPQVQGELFDTPQAGPIQPGVGLAEGPKNYNIPPKLTDAITEARLELNKPDFKDSQRAFGELDQELATKRPEVQGKLFEGLLDQVSGQTPTEFSGTVSGVHGSQEPLGPVQSPGQLDHNIRYDGTGGVWGDGFYSADHGDYSWFRGGDIRMPDYSHATVVDSSFKKAAQITPDNVVGLFERLGARDINTPEELADLLKQHGYDGVIVRGFDGMSADKAILEMIHRGIGTQRLESSSGASALMNQVVHFKPEEGVSIKGPEETINTLTQRRKIIDESVDQTAKRYGFDRAADAQYILHRVNEYPENSTDVVAQQNRAYTLDKYREELPRAKAFLEETARLFAERKNLSSQISELAHRPTKEVSPPKSTTRVYNPDDLNPAYPNQNPRPAFTGELDTPHPNAGPQWTTGDTFLGPEAPLYKDQGTLFVNPLDQLIDQAKYSSEPKPAGTPKEVIPEPSPDVFPTKKYKQGDLGLDKPDLLSKQLDVAGENINGDYQSDLITGDEPPKFPTRQDYVEKKDLPMVMSPAKLFDTFKFTPVDLPRASGELIREVLPNWAKRDLWNDNPILRSAFDNLTHLRDEKSAWLRDILEPRKMEDGTTFNPRKDLDSLSLKEKNDFSHFTIKYDGVERTPTMVQEGRNYFNVREWRERGANEKVANALAEAGKIYEKALKGYNKDAGLRGDHPIDVIPNYFPHRHAGDFFVKITNMTDGKQEVIPFRSLKEAKEATKQIQPNVKEGYSIDYGRKPRGGSDFNDLLESLKERTAKYGGTEPSHFHNMLDNIRKSMDEEFFAGAEKRHGTGHYTGENGFELGDKPKGTNALDAHFVADSAPKYAEDMASYLMGKRINDLKEAYQKAAEDSGVAHTGKWADNRKALERQADLYQGPTFDPEKASYVEHLADGLSKIMDRESVVIGHAPVPWLTRDVLTRRVRNLNKLASTLLITPYMNVSLAVSQFMQLVSSPLNVIGELSRTLGTNEIPNGFIGQLKQTGKTVPFIAEAFAKGLWDAMAPESLTPQKGSNALKWAKSLGHLDTMLKHENLDIKGKIKRTVTFQGVSMLAEHVPRSITFMQGYHAFKNLGFQELAARRASVEFTNTVMGDYTKEGKVEAMRAMGPLTGTMLSPFSTWLWNSKAQVGAVASSLGTHGTKAIGAGTIVPLAALAASVYFITGWGGAPGVQDWDNIAKFSNDTFNTELPTSANIHLEYGKKMFGSDKEANNAYYGKASESSGRDIAQSSRFGSLTDIAVPGIAIAKTLAKSAYYGGKKALSQTGLVDAPTDSDMYRNMKAAAPPSSKTLVEDYYSKPRPDGGEILKSGITRKPNESFNKLLGIPFNDLDEKKQADVNNVANYVKLRQSKMADKQLELIQDKADRHEDMSSNFKKLVDLNPDYGVHPVSVVQSVVQDQIKRNLTQQEFESLSAARGASLNNKQDAQRRNTYMERVLGSK